MRWSLEVQDRYISEQDSLPSARPAASIASAAGSSFRPLAALQLCAEVLWTTIAWSVVTAYPGAIYWKLLDPDVLGFAMAPILTLVILSLSLALLCIPIVQRLVVASGGAIAVLMPVLFGLSAIADVDARCVCLLMSLWALALYAAAVMASPAECTRRRRATEASSISLLLFLAMRYMFATLNPIADFPKVKITLSVISGLASAFSAVADFLEAPPRPRDDAERMQHAVESLDDEPPPCKCRDRSQWQWAPTGIMIGGLLFTFQLYLSQVEAPGANALSEPDRSQGMVVFTILVLGQLILELAPRHAMCGLVSGRLVSVVSFVPTVALVLQLAYTPVMSIPVHGNIRGAGSWCYFGLLLLVLSFPWMLAAVRQQLEILAGMAPPTVGAALATAGLTWAVFCTVYLGVLAGGVVLKALGFLQGQVWVVALLAATTWYTGRAAAGVAAAEAAAREHMRKLASDHPSLTGAVSATAAARQRAQWLAPAAVVLAALSAFGFTLDSAEDKHDPAMLRVAGYNVQQGYSFKGAFPNVHCVVASLKRMKVDLVGISESNAIHPMSGNTDVSLAYAEQARMEYFRGPPGSLLSVDQALLSRLPLSATQSRAFEILRGCKQCPTQTHVWVSAKVRWRGVDVSFHAVHTEWFGDPSPQINWLADQIRTRFRSGPLVLVGDFNVPQCREGPGCSAPIGPLPKDTALVNLTLGTGLREATGALNASEHPFPGTTLNGEQPKLDWIFYRGLRLRATGIDVQAPEVACSDHLPVWAAFEKCPEDEKDCH